jgi:hypothetical protein
MKRVFLLLVLSITMGIYSQNTPGKKQEGQVPTPQAPSTPPPVVTEQPIVSNSEEVPAPQLKPQDPIKQELPKGNLDKEIYELAEKSRERRNYPDKKKLEYNLIYTFKKEIKLSDSSAETQKIGDEIEISKISYEALDHESKYYRGLKALNPEITKQDFMYVVKYDKYMLWIGFKVNPELYIVLPKQSVLFYGRNTKFDPIIPKI